MNRPDGGTDGQYGFDTVLERLRPELLRFAFWLARDRQVAEDVVQEAMVRAWNSRDALADPARARPWLMTIVRREFLRSFERRQLELTGLDELVQAESPLLAAGDDTQLAELREAIFRLEADYREPLVLQVIQGLTTAEIAAELGLTQGAVLTRLFRARRRLAVALGSPLEPGDTA